ncbi:hypothetical protein O1R50_17890 [Glycomyces luteolus]|uniref:Uncharacterized protein n=1 Tax=Glycomyces luteolus TaxID=2670330 RepID=A0A9X3PF86_9ACTN|nr:hypothetical protein [Glycomyces luteolus]MDA1361504.1 hypothetical protein [Glycomyces luteolus]
MRRNLVVSGWVAAAVVAVGAGIGAVALAQGGTLAPPTEPMSEDSVQAQLDSIGTATPSESPTATDDESSPSSEQTTAGEEIIATDGGTVIARCNGTEVELVSVSPAQGWRTVGVDAGPAATAAFGFTDDDDDDDGLHYKVTCADGVPAAALQNTDDDADD